MAGWTVGQTRVFDPFDHCGRRNGSEVLLPGLIRTLLGHFVCCFFEVRGHYGDRKLVEEEFRCFTQVTVAVKILRLK